MEHYIVSARKYRPSTFASVVGQSALTTTLKNAIATGRLGHAYLFCGTRGVGKTSIARIFAKTINCTNRTPDGEPCNECASCQMFNDGTSMDIAEFDAASNNSVDDMRELIENVQQKPTGGRYRVFIIDEVHMLSTAAFNAFLKTLEEPPSYVIFILATTEKHKIIPTILSRCQVYDFNRITVNDMVKHLQYVAREEGVEAEPSALHVIARQADGAMRDALSIFDQVAASSQGHITYESTITSLNVLDPAYYKRILDMLTGGDIPGALALFHEIRRRGFDAQFFINGLGEYLRNLMLASAGATAGLVDAPEDVRQGLSEQASKLRPDFIYGAMGLCNDADLNYRQASNKQLLTELTLIRIAQLLTPPAAKSGLDGGALKPIERRADAQATGTQAPATAATAPAPAAAGAAPPASHPTAAPAPNMPKKAAPAPAVPRPAQGHGKGGLSVGRLSMSRSKEQPAETAPGPRAEAYTESDVHAAWEAAISEHPTEHVLINTMRAAAPARQESGRYRCTVPSAVQGRMLEEVLDRLHAYMRDKLKNDAFEIEICVEEGEPSPQFWNDRQLLSHMSENYPAVRHMIETLNLKLL